MGYFYKFEGKSYYTFNADILKFIFSKLLLIIYLGTAFDYRTV